MNLELNILNKNSIEINLENLLKNIEKNIPENSLFHKEHGVRHPFATYNVMAAKVYEAFNNFFLEFEDINEKINLSEEKSKVRDKVLKQYEEILYTIMEFIDATYIIIKSFYPKSAVKQDIVFAHEWIKKADKNTCYNYFNKIKEYRNNVAIKVNKLKHNAQRMCFIMFETGLGNIYGYYVEGVEQESGELLPDSEIHKDFNNQHTAISFNYDLKYNLNGFLDVIECLAETIENIVYKKYNTKIKLNEQPCGKSDLYYIIEKTKKLPNLFFIDEYEKKIPLIISDKENTIKFKYTKTNKVLRYSGTYRVESVLTGDGISTTYAPAYFDPIKVTEQDKEKLK